MSDQINEQERFDNTMRRIASIVFLFGIFLYVLSIRSEMKHMTTSLNEIEQDLKLLQKLRNEQREKAGTAMPLIKQNQ